MTEIEIDYNKIIYNIINRNGGTRRWPNLRAVDIDVYWKPGADLSDWTKTDYPYPIFQNEELIAKKRLQDVPSHFAFYMESLRYSPEYDNDRFYTGGICYIPCIAFTGTSDPYGELKIQTMCRGDDFDEYHLVMSCKELDVMQENIENIINKIYPGLFPVKIEDAPECEEKLCKFLDVIFDFTTILRLTDGNEIGLKNLQYYPDIQELFDELGKYDSLMDECFEEKPEWQKYDYQHLCLLYIFHVTNGEGDEWLLSEVKWMMKEHKFVLDNFALQYLKEHETSMEYGLEDLQEIYELCGENPS